MRKLESYHLLKGGRSNIIANNSNCKVNLLQSGRVLITYTPGTNPDSFAKADVNIAISAAISSYALMRMSDVMVKHQHQLAAIDTDGIKVMENIDPELIDPKALGKYKHEYTLKYGYFPMSKVYGGEPLLQLVKPVNGKNFISKMRGVSASLHPWYGGKNDIKPLQWYKYISRKMTQRDS